MSEAQARPVALVTGASSGIGLELARLHARRGGDLILVARRLDRLESLAADVERAHGATSTCIQLDLSESDAPARLHADIRRRAIRVDYLVNNAGFGAIGRFDELDWASQAAMIQVNVTSLAALTHLFLGDMLARASGRILNVASVAGFVPGPFQAMYYATKAFVVSFSEALDAELRATGVTVTALCPGMTDTEFFEAAGMEGSRATAFARQSAADVARIGYDGMLRGKRVVVPGLSNKLLVHGALKLLPRRLTTSLSKELGRRRS